MCVTSEVNGLYDELSRLGELSPVGVALARFAESLSPGGRFVRERSRWVYRPDNFVTFAVHHKKSRKLTLTLSGRPVQYKSLSEKADLGRAWQDLERDRSEYSRYDVARPEHLLPAAFFLRCAHHYKHRRTMRTI